MYDLRPIERVIMKAMADGVPVPDIAMSVRKKPGTIKRIAAMADYARSELDRDLSRSTDDQGLRPIERRVMAMRRAGLSTAEIAARLRRGGDHIRRIEAYADLKITGAIGG